MYRVKYLRIATLIFATAFLGLIYSCKVPFQTSGKTDFGKTSWKASAEPVHTGLPGKTPFWNEEAFRFIYAPAFNFEKVADATQYLYKLTSLKNNKQYTFKSDVPYAPLSPIWEKIPVGHFEIKVIGITNKGDSLGLAGSGKYYRAAPFNGPYHKALHPYDVSASIALDSLLNKDYVAYWLTHKKPDPGYVNYRYPAKIMSALVVGAVTHAKLKPNAADKEQSIRLARIIADYLLDISYEKGSEWQYFAPTYSKTLKSASKPYMVNANNFTIMGADAGNAYLDLYDYTGEKKYFEAAKRIADTYLSTQLENGTWYQLVNYKTGKPVAPNLVIPTAVINYFNRLKSDYQVEGLDKSTESALKWVMENPAKTFNWQGQYEDVSPQQPYHNQNREQACDLAIYLFKNNRNIKLAEELVRFSEDQFVIWEQPIDIPVRKSGNPVYKPTNWITPCVLEQYAYWMPVGRAAGIMVETYWQAYHATKKEIYLAKAKSIANAFTVMQKEHDGNYSTYFTKYPIEQWLNSTVYPAKVLMNLEDRLKTVK